MGQLNKWQITLIYFYIIMKMHVFLYVLKYFIKLYIQLCILKSNYMYMQAYDEYMCMGFDKSIFGRLMRQMWETPSVFSFNFFFSFFVLCNECVLVLHEITLQSYFYQITWTLLSYETLSWIFPVTLKEHSYFKLLIWVQIIIWIEIKYLNFVSLEFVNLM